MWYAEERPRRSALWAVTGVAEDLCLQAFPYSRLRSCQPQETVLGLQLREFKEGDVMRTEADNHVAVAT